MSSDPDKVQAECTDLRRRATDRLKGQVENERLHWAETDRLRLAHELEVHQIELEMQNEQLRNSQEEVETSLAKFTNLYDFAPVGYFTLDGNGVIRAVNLGGANLFGVERAKLIGRRFESSGINDARRQFADFLARVMQTRAKESCELSIVNQGNCPVWLQLEAVAAASGQECFVAAIDVTGRKSAEAELARKQQQLADLNNSLHDQIEQAVTELRHKDQLLILQDRFAVMGEMINNIAHQWRQPLNALGLLIQQLPLVYDSAAFSREFLARNVAQSMEQIQHMSQTIDDFRLFFRSDKEAVTFSVAQAIGKTLSLIEKSFLDQQIRITVKMDGEPLITGYLNEYAQVLLNILMNARDVLVGKAVVDALIALHGFTEAGKTVVTIADNAGGIPVEIIDRLFDPYFTTKGPEQGTGIGLFMSKTIIEKNMHGRLSVRNHAGGAEFRIEV